MAIKGDIWIWRVEQHLLPPANEVWGKVLFSEACVKNSVNRGGGGGIAACIADGIPVCLTGL